MGKQNPFRSRAILTPSGPFSVIFGEIPAGFYNVDFASVICVEQVPQSTHRCCWEGGGQLQCFGFLCSFSVVVFCVLFFCVIFLLLLLLCLVVLGVVGLFEGQCCLLPPSPLGPPQRQRPRRTCRPTPRRRTPPCGTTSGRSAATSPPARSPRRTPRWCSGQAGAGGAEGERRVNLPKGNPFVSWGPYNHLVACRPPPPGAGFPSD